MQTSNHGRIREWVFRLLLFAVAIYGGAAWADNAAFDLAGPRIEITVNRAGRTLPIAAVPNLQAGDRLWVHPDLPDDQSFHYLLVIAFLRGTTNPPPDEWFTRAETWNRNVRAEGILATVPKDAQQALVFLAPVTGGDFDTLRAAVRSKPGVFVRASQDLNQANLDRTRSNKYLSEVKKMGTLDPKMLHDRSGLLAKTLGIRLDEQCFGRPPEQQSTCLTQNTDQLVVDDGHSQSMVAALTTGPSADLMGQITATSVAGGGFYSAYVGAVVDLAKLMGSLHTASYQYIPALSELEGSQVNLRLNNPPSFRKPMSVIVMALPAVEAQQLPPLRSANKEEIFCLQKTPLVLPIEGAPVVFSTKMAHDFVLHVSGESGEGVDLPAAPDPSQGGFVIDVHGLTAGRLDSSAKGVLRGYWGFDAFEGPAFQLMNAHAAKWVIPAADQASDRGSLVVGRENILYANSEAAACVSRVRIQNESGMEIATSWKAIKANELEVHVPMEGEKAGPLTMTIQQFGAGPADRVDLQAYAEAARLDSFEISSGDHWGVLTGTRLDQVSALELKQIRFEPAKLSRVGKEDELSLSEGQAGTNAELSANEKIVARVHLKDGRVLDLQTTVGAPRPEVELMSKNVESEASHSPVHLTNHDSLPQDGRMTFLLKTKIPESFPRTEKIEVASEDSSFHAFLSLQDGSLILQDSQMVLAVLDPLKSFGTSAFGPLRFRPVDGDGRTGDWQPLATLVRIPALKEVRCPDSPDQQCKLTGVNLFLIDSVASDPEFTHNVSVPIGFADSSLNVPRPNGTLLYIKLRDDPNTVNTVTLPVLPDGQ